MTDRETTDAGTGDVATPATDPSATDPSATDPSAPDPSATDRSLADGPVTGSRPTLRPRRLALFGVVAAVALALDIVSKVLAVAQLSDRAPVRLLGGALYVQLARNPGAAFSQGTGFTVVITGLAVVIVAVILVTARRLRSRGWAIGLGLVLGGALGNLVDRLLRAPSPGKGHVVDWISVFGPNGERYPIFNLADSAVCVGAAFIVVLAIRGIGLDGRRAEKKPKSST
ncbi:signal peptidase II [Jatrophihabitans sp. YIM 134969]